MPKTPTKPTSVNRRILILGSANHTKLVTAYEWDKLPNKLNVSDFDTIILNFKPFQDKSFAKSLNIDLMPNWQQFARHFFSKDSEIIAIGSPEFSLGKNPYLPSTWWLPVDLDCTYETGEDIRNIHQSFEFYFKFVHHWSFHLENIREKFGDFARSYLTVAGVGEHPLRARISNLAETRFGRPIGFALQFEVLDRGADYMYTPKVIRSSGFVFWLPEPSDINVTEAINLILRERYSLQFEKNPPSWVEEFQLPSQLPILKEINEKENAVVELTKQLKNQREKLDQVSRFLKLLYEQGEDVLEPVVRDALRELGASVEDPKIKGREDGRMVDPFARNAMLEIKGRSGNLKLSDVRELDNWVRDAMANENWHSKGLLIANLQCEEDPRKRTNPIPTNCTDAAKIFDISILTTIQLFKALASHQKHELDKEAFWNEVFSSQGLCKLPDIT